MIVTRGNGSVNIKAHVIRTNVNDIIFTINTTRGICSLNHVYTNRVSFKENTNNNLRPVLGFSSNTETILYQEYKENTCVMVGISQANNSYPVLKVYSNNSTNEFDLDVDISNYACYEGQFINPPYIRSLDYNPNAAIFAEHNNIETIITSADYGTLGSLIVLKEPVDYTLGTTDMFLKYFIKLFTPHGKKIKACIGRGYLGNGNNWLGQFDITVTFPSFNQITYVNKFSQLIGWRAYQLTTISNVLNQTIRTDYRGSEYIPVTFEIQHVNNSSYTRIYTTIDMTNSVFTNYSACTMLELTLFRSPSGFYAPDIGFTDLTNS